MGDLDPLEIAVIVAAITVLFLAVLGAYVYFIMYGFRGVAKRPAARKSAQPFTLAEVVNAPADRPVEVRKGYGGAKLNTSRGRFLLRYVASGPMADLAIELFAPAGFTVDEEVINTFKRFAGTDIVLEDPFMTDAAWDSHIAGVILLDKLWANGHREQYGELPKISLTLALNALARTIVDTGYVVVMGGDTGPTTA